MIMHRCNEISFYEALCHADEIQGLGKAEAKIRPFVNMIQDIPQPPFLL